MASVTDFLNANSHENSVTGCRIWDGDVDRSGNPVFEMGGQKMLVRALVIAADRGPQASRTKYVPVCENSRCVRVSHIETEVPAKKQTEFDGSQLAAVNQAFFVEGKRQDVVAAELGISQPQVSKIVAHLRRGKFPHENHT